MPHQEKIPGAAHGAPGTRPCWNPDLGAFQVLALLVAQMVDEITPIQRRLQIILLRCMVCITICFVCKFQDSVVKLLERNELDHLDPLDQKVHK